MRTRLSAGYLAIIVFKYIKLAAFLLLGLGALRIAGLPEGSGAHEVARALGAHETEALVRHVAAAVSVLTPRQIEAIGAAGILMGLVFGAEGTLLAFRVAWAPYLTIVLTALAIPFEIVEIANRPDSVRRYALLAVNAAILVYLWKRRNDFRTPEAR